MAKNIKDMTDDEWDMLARIGAMFKDLRTEAGMTQKEAAAAAQTSQARVPVLEHGQADIMVTTLMKWANVYGFELQVNLVPIEDEFTKMLREAAKELESEVA